MKITRFPRWIVATVVLVALTYSAAAQSTQMKSIDPPAGPGAMAPNLSTMDGQVVVTWVEPVQIEQTTKRDRQHRLRALRFARYTDEGWSEPKTIAERDNFFANWADLPAFVQGSDGTLFAHWLEKSADATYAYDVIAGRSTDRGENWQTLGQVHEDQTNTEHGFVSFVTDADGVRAFWLDGREMAGDENDSHGGAEGGSMTLRTAIVGSDMATSTLIDNRVCECCNTSAAMTDRGPIVVYRDRSSDEIRDIYIVRGVDDDWTQPRPLFADEWKIAGCPVNGPAIAADGSLVVVAWFTGATDSGSVRAVFSTDSGAHFGEPIAVDDTRPIGRVGVMLLDDGDAIISWLDAGDEEGAIVVRRVSADGLQGDPMIVARTSGARRIGFPKIARVGSSVLVVWTQDDQPTRLRAVTIPIRQVPAPSPTLIK